MKFAKTLDTCSFAVLAAASEEKPTFLYLRSRKVETNKVVLLSKVFNRVFSPVIMELRTCFDVAENDCF
jgi:hypothetical protein